MSKRRITYGYVIENGETVTHDVEAQVVRRIFQSYLDGESFQRISDVLNRDQIPFSVEASTWDKHKVKRVLEQRKYLGEGGFPKIVEQELFETVQRIIRSKQKSGFIRTPQSERVIWDRLVCGCGGQILVEESAEHGGSLKLQCHTCGATHMSMREALFGEIGRQIDTYVFAPQERAEERRIRTANAINRSLERPDDMKSAISLILDGISARYACCTVVDAGAGSSQLDYDCVNRFVSHIGVYGDGRIEVNMK